MSEELGSLTEKFAKRSMCAWLQSCSGFSEKSLFKPCLGS